MHTFTDCKQRRIDRIWRSRMAGCLILLAACLLPVPGLAQIKTTVADNLLGPDGSSASGTMTISAAGAFRSADGYNVAQGWRIQIPVVAGSFSVSLIPNQGATPTGQNDTYTVTYNLTSSLGSSYWTETWFVPSAGPVGLAAVRTLPAFPANFLSPQTANTVLAGPVSGSAGAASFRPLVCADLPGGCSGGDGGSMTWPTSAGIPNYSGSSSWRGILQRDESDSRVHYSRAQSEHHRQRCDGDLRHLCGERSL